MNYLHAWVSMHVNCRLQGNLDAIWIQRGHKHCSFTRVRVLDESGIPLRKEKDETWVPTLHINCCHQVQLRCHLLMYKDMTSGKKKKKQFKNDLLKFPLNETLGDLSNVSKRKREGKNKTKHKIKVYTWDGWRKFFILKDQARQHAAGQAQLSAYEMPSLTSNPSGCGVGWTPVPASRKSKWGNGSYWLCVPTPWEEW